MTTGATLTLEQDIQRVRAQIEWQRDYRSDAREEMVGTLESFERSVSRLRFVEQQYKDRQAERSPLDKGRLTLSKQLVALRE